LFIFGSSKDQVTDCTITNVKPAGEGQSGLSSWFLMPNAFVLKALSDKRI
jgi:hypothetical protein